MSERDKLIELFCEAKKTDPESAPFSEFLADYLISNGVTFQQWIPVTERLPEESGTYIVCCDDSGCPMDEGIWYQSEVVVCAECEVYRNSVGWTWYENGTEYDLEGIVTHWMELPCMPKEG